MKTPIGGNRYVRSIDLEAAVMAASGTRHIVEIDMELRRYKSKALCGYSPEKWEKKPRPRTELSEATCKKCLKAAEKRGLLLSE